LNITENVLSIKSKIAEAARTAGRSPEDITLVAATKMNGAEAVRQAILAGVPVCGENRAQELTEKYAQGAYEGAGVHFIGHLQKNKARQVVGVCSLIQSVDSVGLLAHIDKLARELGIIQDVLLEVNVGGEETKYGFSPEQLPPVLEQVSNMSGVRVRGLMTIPPISDYKGRNRVCFARMYQLFIDISAKKYDNVYMNFLSMGMSGDFEDAIAEGSNMVRVGSAIFGPRIYPAADK